MVCIFFWQFLMVINVETFGRLSNGQDVNSTYIEDIYAGFCKTNKCYNDKFETTSDRDLQHNNSTGCDCLCDISCFISGICCPKIFFDYKTCTETNILHSNPQQKHTKPVLMIDRCPNTSDYTLRKECEISSDLETQLQNTPVTSINSGHTFRNIYCLNCFNIYNVSLDRVRTWTLKIECKDQVNFNFFPSYSAVIKHAKTRNCDIFFRSSSSITKHCQINFEKTNDTISTCNVSGTWTTYDRNIELACQIYDNSFYSFKNVFCFLCNPFPENVILHRKVKENCNDSCNRTDILNTSCTDKGMLNIYDLDVEHNCKNIMRTECNLPIIKYFCRLYTSINEYKINSRINLYDVSFRAVFDISKYSNNFEQIPTTNKCNETQVLDSKKNDCRGIMCYPGRILLKTGCVPIFKTTRDLAYILSLGMTTELVHDIDKPLSFLKSVRRSFAIYLKSILNIQTVTVTSSVFLANSICAENITLQNGTKLNISLYRKFVIREYVERSNLEEQLIYLQNGYFVVRYGRKKYNFKLFKNVEALTAESHISTLRYLQRCFLKRIKQTKDSYVYSHVNKLLVCKQIEFETTEFNIRFSKLIVLSTKIELDYDEYAIMSSGKARICLETFRKMLTEDKPEGRNVWGIIEVTCACTSLVCLVVTFITYCVFPTLRTLPGKINMCLVFAMFHGHALFYFILYGSRSHVACMIIGTLVHYFWLVIFGCLNVCSFHMYQAFTSETVVVFSEVKRLCIYIAYSYGVPAIIVSSNVLFTYIYSDKKTFGYVGDICFLNHQLSFVFSFIVPITLVCCSNLFFFTTTVMQIVKRPKLENERQIKLNRLHAAIYLKLFSVTGISWLLQIIDTFLPMSVFSRIVSGLNGLQGIFIFWSFICNKRVFNLYLKSCRSNLNKTVKEIAGKSEQETKSTELTTSKQEE